MYCFEGVSSKPQIPHYKKMKEGGRNTTPFTMEVHYTQYEWGLCDFVANSFESLETHLSTCEIFKCDECEKRFQTISDMKAHIETDHEESSYFTIMHAKQSRYDSEEWNRIED